jgi:hypothetical protein
MTNYVYSNEKFNLRGKLVYYLVYPSLFGFWVLLIAPPSLFGLLLQQIPWEPLHKVAIPFLIPMAITGLAVSTPGRKSAPLWAKKIIPVSEIRSNFSDRLKNRGSWERATEEQLRASHEHYVQTAYVPAKKKSWF